MWTKFFQGRAWRKLRRNPLAIGAASVIVVYLAIALLGFVGVISKDAAQQRVLPDKTPGWFEDRSVDTRASDLTWLIDRISDRVARAQALDDNAARRRVLSEVNMAERKLIDEPFEQITEKLAAFEDEMDVLYEAFEAYDIVAEDITVAEQRVTRFRDRDPERFADRIAEAEQLIAANRLKLPELLASAEAELDRVEAEIESIMPTPTGLAGAVYKLRICLGSDNQGRSIMIKSLFSVRIAFQIGFVVAIASVVIGTALGAAAAFYGGWVDYAVMYLVSVLSSVPSLVLLAVIVYIFFGSPVFDNPAERPGLALIPVYAAMGLTYWVGTCRVIRGEVMKIKGLEYVQAATSIGFGRMYTLIKHVIPNTAHLMFINFALLFIGAIKSEVILSFLGLGVKGQPSWGRMISQGKDDVIVGFFWEVGAASVFMFGLVLAFNILTDALQDAFDPRHVD